MKRVKKTYSIRDLASEFGITTRTIRFYEEKGYLNPKRKFIVRIGEKRAELESKQKDLKVMMNDLQSVEDKCHVALAQYRKRA